MGSNAIGMASKSMRQHAMRAAMDLDGMGQHSASGKRDFAIIGLGLQKIPTNSSQ